MPGPGNFSTSHCVDLSQPVTDPSDTNENGLDYSTVQHKIQSCHIRNSSIFFLDLTDPVISEVGKTHSFDTQGHGFEQGPFLTHVTSLLQV